MTLQLVTPQSISQPAQLKISYSQLSLYLICPMKYGHTYVWATKPETKPVNMILGRAVHRAAELFYKRFQQTGEILSVEELISKYETEYDQDIQQSDVRIGLKKDETIDSVKETGVGLVRLFHSEIKPQKIIAVELPFAIPVPDIHSNENLPVLLVGYFDLVESDSDGTYLISELKTSAQKYSSLKLQYDLQPTVYSYAMSRMKLATSQNSCLVRYDCLVKNKTPVFEHYFVARTRADFDRLIHLINYILTAIEHRLFYRNMGWQCQDCQFKKTCLG